MTRTNHRRRPRRDGGTLELLEEWRRRVERAERRAQFGPKPRDVLDNNPTIVRELTGCPACDGPFRGWGARDRLERVMRRNSRKGHRLRAAVARLDERYRDVTVEVDAPAGFSWWDRRLPYT